MIHSALILIPDAAQPAAPGSLVRLEVVALRRRRALRALGRARRRLRQALPGQWLRRRPRRRPRLAR